MPIPPQEAARGFDAVGLLYSLCLLSCIYISRYMYVYVYICICTYLSTETISFVAAERGSVLNYRQLVSNVACSIDEIVGIFEGLRSNLKSTTIQHFELLVLHFTAAKGDGAAQGLPKQTGCRLLSRRKRP